MPDADREQFERENELVKFIWEAMSPEPPDWAKDPFNRDAASKCCRCGAWMGVVRPGKVQCDVCPYLEHANTPKEPEGV